MNSGSTISGLYFEITNLTEGEAWQYLLPTPGLGAVANYQVPFSTSASGWVQNSGDESFAFILSQIEEVGISFTTTGPAKISGSIDNVTTVPEPSALVFALAGLTILTRRRRDLPRYADRYCE